MGNMGDRERERERERDIQTEECWTERERGYRRRVGREETFPKVYLA